MKKIIMLFATAMMVVLSSICLAQQAQGPAPVQKALDGWSAKETLNYIRNFSAVTPWFRVTADLQWIDPANGDNDHAWIGGLRANMIF